MKAKSIIESGTGMMLAAAALAGLAWPTSLSAAAMDVALTVRETAGVARAKDPCRSGIPLVPGAVTDPAKLRLLDAAGAEVPAQFRVINRRPAGDIEWVCVDFLADVPASGAAVYRLTDSGPTKAVVDKPVTVEDKADKITVANGGDLKLVIPKKAFAGLGEVSLGGTVVSKGGTLVVKGVDGKVYRSVADLTAPLTVAVEESGPLHAVIRIDGEMKCQSADGKEHFYPRYNKDTREVNTEAVKIANKDGSLGFTVRLHVWKDQSWVRTFVTMRNLNGWTAGWTEVKFQFGDYWQESVQKPGNFLVDAVNLELDLNTTGKLAYRIGGGIDGTEVHTGEIEPAKGSVVLHQDSSASWLWQATTNRIFDARVKENFDYMKNWAAKQAKEKGEDVEAAVVKVKPYYEFQPYWINELSIKRDGFRFMGYRLYTDVPEVTPAGYASFAELGKETAEGMRAPGWIEVSDGKVSVTAGCRWFWQMCPKSLELRAPGKLSVGLWSQYYSRGHVFEGKIHKTHELVYDFRPSTGSGQGAAGKGLDAPARFAAFSQRLIATPDARHNLASRVYGDFMLPNPQDWPRYEMSAAAAVTCGVDRVSNPGRASSMEIEREKMDNYDVWRFGDSNKDSWHYFGQYQELDVPYCLMVHYARTGDIRYFRMAEEIGRMLLDIPAHGGGHGHQMGEGSHYYVVGPLMYANTAAEPFLRDAIRHSHDITQTGAGHLRSVTVTLWSNTAIKQGFGDPDGRCQAMIDKALKRFVDVQKPNGELGGFSRTSQVFMLGMAGDSIGRYCEDHPENKELRDRFVRGFAEWMDHLQKQPEEARKNLMDKTTANGFAFATRFSNDPKYLDFAAANIVVDESFHTWYRTGVCSAKNWSETISSHRLIQVFMHDIDKRKHPERYPK